MGIGVMESWEGGATAELGRRHRQETARQRVSGHIYRRSSCCGNAVGRAPPAEMRLDATQNACFFRPQCVGRSTTYGGAAFRHRNEVVIASFLGSEPCTNAVSLYRNAGCP